MPLMRRRVALAAATQAALAAGVMPSAAAPGGGGAATQGTRIVTPDGLRLFVREAGDPAGPPILFVHGWSQHHLAWHRQLAAGALQGFRLVALDLRGHGASDAPEGDAHYGSLDIWADDIRAVILGLGLRRPVLVGWSFGGLVALGYLRRHGEQDIAGVNLVGAAFAIGSAWFGSHIGPGFLEHGPATMSEDQPAMLEALLGFLRASTAAPLPAEEFALFAAFNALVRPGVRRAIAARDESLLPVLDALRLPVRISHGRADRVILPRAAEDALARHPRIAASWYEGVGHLPFIEAQARFDRELAEFRAAVA